MNNSEMQLIIDKNINDNNWSCLVVFLIESNPSSVNGIDLFEKHVRSAKRTDIQILSPEDLEPLFRKERANIKETAPQDTIKFSFKSETLDSNPSKIPSNVVQALIFKKYILEYKVKDLAKRSEAIRYLLNSDIILPDSDNSISEAECGAFCFFVVTKFYDPSLLNILIEMEVPLVAVFEFRVEAELTKSKAPYNPTNLDIKKGRSESIGIFWNEFTKQLNDPENKDYFSEFLFLPIEINSAQWNDKKREDILFEHIFLKLQSIERLMRKYIHYINNVEIVNAPTTFTEVNQDIYDEYVDSIPLECVTIELIVHCIVEQVSAQLEIDLSVPYIENFGSTFEGQDTKFPLLFLNHRDKIRRMTFNLKKYKINFDEVACKMNCLMPYTTIWNLYPPPTEVEKALNANQIKKLLTCVNEVVSEERFLILLHLISLNKLVSIATNSQLLNEAINDQQVLDFLSILDKEENNVVEDDTISNALNANLLPKRQEHLNTLKNFLVSSEFDSLISYEFLNDLQDFSYVEDIPKETLLQVLNKAHKKFLHGDYYYCPLTDKLLLWFHNFRDEHGLHSQIQEGLLNAKIGFGDFCTYPDDRTEKWLLNQKKQIITVDEALKKAYLSRNFSDINPLSFALNPTIKVKIPFPIKQYMKSKSGKAPFTTVYDSFGLSRIKVSEQTDTFFSVDGPSLTFKKTKWLRHEGSITVILNSYHNLLTLHQPLLNLYATQIYESNHEIAFNIQSKKGIIVSSKINISTEDVFLPTEPKKENIAHYETLITLPNGLIIELFRGKYNFIKQTFLDKTHIEDDHLKQEDYRIFLTDGTVIVFMNDGSIIILYSNSVHAKIKVMGKKPPKYRNSKYDEPQESKEEDDMFDEKEEMTFEIIRHEIIGWNGRFLRFNRDEIILSKQLYQLRYAFCSNRGLFTERSDGTKCYVDLDGILTISFPDKTITTVIPNIECVYSNPVDSNDSSSVKLIQNEDKESFVVINNKYIMDHPFYMKVEFVSEQWTVHLPFEGLITASTKGYELAFDKTTKIELNDRLLLVTSRNKADENKNTLTKILLKGEVANECTICSVQTSDGKVFNVSNTGFSSIQNITTSNGEEIIKTQQDRTVHKKKVKSDDSLSKPNSSQISPSQKNFNIFKSILHFKNQTLLYSKIYNQLENVSNLNNTTPKPIKSSSNSREVNQCFVVNRDLSGYELITECDIMSTFKKYETNFKIFNPFFPCKTVANDITVCQMPLTKTWNQRYWCACCESRLYNTNFKKNELFHCPPNQKWLCIPRVCTSDKKTKFANKYKPIVENNGLKHPAMLIRRFKNIKTSFNIFEMLTKAVKQFNDINCEILLRYEKNLVPVKKVQSDIDTSEMIFKHAMEELMHSKVKLPFTMTLAKGDSISTIASSESSIKLDESGDSDDTDSQRIATSSQSDSNK